MLAKSDGALACKSAKLTTRTRATDGDLLRDASDHLARLRRIVKSWRRGIGRRRRRRLRRAISEGPIISFPGAKFYAPIPNIIVPPARCLTSSSVWTNSGSGLSLKPPFSPRPGRLSSPPVSRPLAVKLGGQTDIRRRACPPSPRRRRNGRRGERERSWWRRVGLRGSSETARGVRDSRLSAEFDLAPEVDKGRVLWINYRNYVISLPRSPRARAFDDSESNWPDMYDSPGDVQEYISME